MEFHTSEEHQLIRDAVRKICRGFPDEYWAARDEAQESLQKLMINRIFGEAGKKVIIEEFLRSSSKLY